MQTAGRVVIVTGGSSGIGAATARRFVAAGDTVINFDLVCGTDPRIPWQQVDVSDWDDVTGAVDKIVDRYGHIDVAIANAGISTRHSVLETTEAEFRRILNVNLVGVFAFWRACAVHMVPAQEGVLLATASTNGTVGYPLYADYNASKAGVLALCRSLALELSPYVRGVCREPWLCTDTDATCRVHR